MEAQEYKVPLATDGAGVSNDESTNEDAAAPHSDGWVPTALRQRTLLLLTLLFLTITIVIGVLYVLSLRNNGLCDAHSTDHYLWTYAPTGLFTIVATLWSQVEYRAKQMQAWRSMAEGSKDASESVLLDYISGWNVLVLFHPVKRRQIVVGLAVSASLVLQLLIVLSTGLITLSEVTTLEAGVEVAVKDSFTSFLPNGSHFRPYQVDARPAALAMAFAQTDIEKPAGTTLLNAFQQFTTPQELAAGVQSVEASVDVLSSALDCDNAELRVEVWPVREQTCYKTHLLSGAGSISRSKSTWTCIAEGSATSVSQTMSQTTGSSVSTRVFECSPLSPNATFQTSPSTSSTLPNDYRGDSPWTFSQSCGNITAPTGKIPSNFGLEVVDCPRLMHEDDSRRLLFWANLPPTTTNITYAAKICRMDYCRRRQPVIA